MLIVYKVHFEILKKNTHALRFSKFICQVLFWLAEVSLHGRFITWSLL